MVSERRQQHLTARHQEAANAYPGTRPIRHREAVLQRGLGLTSRNPFALPAPDAPTLADSVAAANAAANAGAKRGCNPMSRRMAAQLVHRLSSEQVY